MTGFVAELSRKENKYIGKWVAIAPSGMNRTFLGYLQRVEGNHAILNPFLAWDYLSEGDKIVEKRKFVEEESSVPLGHASIEPTTRESLENFVLFNNQKKEEEKK